MNHPFGNRQHFSPRRSNVCQHLKSSRRSIWEFSLWITYEHTEAAFIDTCQVLRVTEIFKKLVSITFLFIQIYHGFKADAHIKGSSLNIDKEVRRWRLCRQFLRFRSTKVRTIDFHSLIYRTVECKTSPPFFVSVRVTARWKASICVHYYCVERWSKVVEYLLR